MAGSRLIERGVAALRAGRRDEARELLRQATEADPRSAQAWLWLSAVVEGIDAQRQCLYKVIEIEPNNSIARSGLAFISRLRAGEEWRAKDAPWIMGLEEAGTAPTRPCPRCQTLNPRWAYTCSGCGAVLQAVDIVETAKTELLVEKRSNAAAAVMLSWPSALVLSRKRTFEPEVDKAAPIRSFTALLLGGLALVLFRAGLRAITLLLAGQRLLLPLLQRVGDDALQGAVVVLAATVVTLVAALVTFVLARLVGGKGGLLVHLHLMAVAASCWLAIAAAFALIAWGLGFVIAEETLALVENVLIGLLALYGLVLSVQAVQTAQRIHPFLATVCVAAAIIGTALAYLFLRDDLESSLLFGLQCVIVTNDSQRFDRTQDSNQR